MKLNDDAKLLFTYNNTCICNLSELFMIGNTCKVTHEVSMEGNFVDLEKTNIFAICSLQIPWPSYN